MSVVDQRTDITAELSAEALDGLKSVPICAGARCLNAVNIALEVQHSKFDEEVSDEVSRRVGRACLQCREIYFEPCSVEDSVAASE